MNLFSGELYKLYALWRKREDMNLHKAHQVNEFFPG